MGLCRVLSACEQDSAWLLVVRGLQYCVYLCVTFSANLILVSPFVPVALQIGKKSLAQKCFHRTKLWRYAILEVCVFLKVKNSKTMVQYVQ